MHDWLAQLIAAKRRGECLTLPEEPLPGCGHVLALAPHPDDPDAVAVLLHALAAGGWNVYWSILASGWSGVEDRYAGPDSSAKGAVRRAEESAAAACFGLPEDRLAFLDLTEGDDGNIIDNAGNLACLHAHLYAMAPAIIVHPYRDDTHPDHRLVARWTEAWARMADQPVLILGNEDPKSVDFRPDLQLVFGAETAAWKAGVLECHRSQSARNQATRGITFAERILGMNRDGDAYAERFTVTTYP
jgi:LmbE family N-acetylglucosaminyl deacetylase